MEALLVIQATIAPEPKGGAGEDAPVCHRASGHGQIRLPQERIQPRYRIEVLQFFGPIQVDLLALQKVFTGPKITLLIRCGKHP